jgi:hypothetical protein
MDEITKKTNSGSTSSSPSSTEDSDKSDSKTELTLDKYNKVKNGMSYKEVVDIMGNEGVEQMSSGEGKYKVESYKWEGDDSLKFTTISFMGGKVYTKFQMGLK